MLWNRKHKNTKYFNRIKATIKQFENNFQVASLSPIQKKPSDQKLSDQGTALKSLCYSLDQKSRSNHGNLSYNYSMNPSRRLSFKTIYTTIYTSRMVIIESRLSKTSRFRRFFFVAYQKLLSHFSFVVTKPTSILLVQ